MTAEVHQLTIPPLTEEEVFAICEELKNEGQSVTRRAVAKRAGRGSMTTIVRMVSFWEDKQVAHAEARDVELTADDTETSGIPSFLGMGEVDPDVWHLKYRSTEAAM
jgi:hypothetical protein